MKKIQKLKMNADQLRKFKGKKPKGIKQDIYIILDNVLDTYNIGAIFRLADAVAAKKIFLCGNTETPPNSRIKKASINTTEVVEWEYAESALQAIQNLQFSISNLQIIAIEQSPKSTPYDKFEYKLPLALVVGNETYGVSKEVLDLCDSLPAGQAGVVELPMFGVNISLNVMVSLGIVLYKVIENITMV